MSTFDANTQKGAEPAVISTHLENAAGWSAASVGSGAITAQIAAAGWTPAALCGLLMAVSSFGMMLSSLLKAGEPYFQRLMDERARARGR